MMTDDEIEALAKKHIAPHADRLANIRKDWPPYQQTEQFRRVKAFVRDVEAKLRAPVADERAAFETAYTGMLNDRSTPPTFAAFMRNPDGSYALPIVERAWAMWQARAALASAPVAGERISDDTLWSWAEQIMGGKEAHHVGRDRVLRFARAMRESTPASTDDIAGYMVGTDYFRPDVHAAAARIYAENRGLEVRALRYANAAPQASEADPLQGAADWLMRAFEPPLSASDLARQLVIGYNRATRLRDAALSAQQASEEGK